MEIHFGEFYIEGNMNQPLNVDAILAEYRNGFLEILLQKFGAKIIPISDKDA